MLAPIFHKNHKEVIKRKSNDSLSGMGRTALKTEDAFTHALEKEFESKALLPNPPSVSWEEISVLVAELENQGQSLSKSPSLGNFHHFRNLLQKILIRILPQAFELKKDYSLNTADLTQKEFHLITGVSKEMASLLKMIESNHKDHFKIANQVISIKGLIIDFYS